MSFPAWYYNELQQVGTDFEDLAQVAAYDRNQTSSSLEAEQQLVNCLGIANGQLVIDFGCGTGTFAIAAALAGANVFAIDVSQSMVNYAQQKAVAAGVSDQIQFCRQGFLTYEHPHASVDFVVTKSALHHLPDFWKMVAFLRMNTMLKQGGVLYLRDVVFSFNPSEHETRINAWIERVAKPAGCGWTASDFESHVREEYTTFSWILEGLLTRSGFEIQQATYPTCEYAEYVCKKKEDMR